MSEHHFVTVEVEVVDGPLSEWQPVGSVCDSEPPGSFSSELPGGGRGIYLAGWVEGDGPGIWRSAGGVDALSANDAIRQVLTTGLVCVADLRDGQPHTLDLVKGGVPIRLRFCWCHRGR